MSLFVQGLSDYNKGKEPQRDDEVYLDGYTRLRDCVQMIKTDKEQAE